MTAFQFVLQGDSWMLPGVIRVGSASRNYVAEVTPSFLLQQGTEAGERNARAVVSACPAPGVTNVVWSGKLMNPMAPVSVLVSDGGHLVTMDEWHFMGSGTVIAIYDPKGRLLRQWTMEELFEPEEMSRLPRSVSSTWWHAGPARFGSGNQTNVLIVPAVGRLFRISLADGGMLTNLAMPGEDKPGGSVERWRALQPEKNGFPQRLVGPQP